MIRLTQSNRKDQCVCNLAHGHTFSGQEGLVNVKIDGFKESHIRWHDISSLQRDDITWNDHSRLDNLEIVITDDFCGGGSHATQSAHGLFTSVLLNESNSGVCDDDKDEDTGFKPIVDNQGENGRNAENSILRGYGKTNKTLTMGLKMFSSRMW
jgi:hypothetical protein